MEQDEYQNVSVGGGGDAASVQPDLPGSPSTGPEFGEGDSRVDPDTGLPAEPALDPDPVDDANPETNGAG